MNIVTFLLNLFAFIEFINNVPEILAEETHFNVSALIEGHENIYFQLKRRKPSIRPPKEEKLQTKQEICLEILSNDVFNAHNMELVNPNHKTVYDQVKLHHPKIHDDHYKAKSSLEMIKPKFANRYRLREVSIQGNVVREYVFACLAKHYTTKNILQYFISPAYTNGPKEVVRFVFTLDEKTKDLTVIAMARKHSHTDAEKNIKQPSLHETELDDDSVESSYEEDKDTSSY